MAQENLHLTTEQLSAYLDELLAETEQSELEAHLHACEQCQQELKGLRQMVALLHAMPQPRLPRSFVLPVDTSFFPDVGAAESPAEDSTPIPLEGVRARQVAAQSAPVAQRRSRWPVYARAALRSISAIAAVLGLVLFMSGLLGAMPSGGGASSVSTASQAVPSHAPQANQAYGANNSAEGTASTPTAAGVPKATNTAGSTDKQSIQSAPTATANDASPRLQASKPSTGEVSTSAPTSPTILIFDLSVPQARLGFGFLLLLLGCMGFIVFKSRKLLAARRE